MAQGGGLGEKKKGRGGKLKEIAGWVWDWANSFKEVSRLGWVQNWAEKLSGPKFH